MAKAKKTSRPIPPADITGEAADEWNRVSDAVEAVGHPIRDADLSILATYCRTWVVNRRLYAHIEEHGTVETYNNGAVGQSPQYKNWSETTKLLKDLLRELGCTPLSRKFDKKEQQTAAPPKLEF